ncbi:class II glutamine amidotransferase [Halosimplex rubrum]|uniref:Class II glutamine amidotransferase n=2 Tax=Halosimplex rubrum TaxID=869889 RepID=A0A7D5TRN9_9EURY|nr:class II glutamine amidotransferase [Halosimplex rubrum]
MFALRSSVSCRVQESLLDADKSLQRLSEVNPHGWGVGQYVQGVPEIVKSPEMAAESPVYSTLSNQIDSSCVVAHVRRATHGDHTVANTHPFQYGRWLFAHNGNIADFDDLRATLLDEIAPSLRSHIVGTTDSEVLFYRLLTAMSDAGVLGKEADDIGPQVLWESISSVVERVAELAGGMHDDPDGPSDETYLTFVLTDGSTLIGHQGGKSLFVHAPAINYGDQTKSWAVGQGATDHFLLASEPAHNPRMWASIQHGGVVGVSPDMTVWTSSNALAV